MENVSVPTPMAWLLIIALIAIAVLFVVQTVGRFKERSALETQLANYMSRQLRVMIVAVERCGGYAIHIEGKVPTLRFVSSGKQYVLTTSESGYRLQVQVPETDVDPGLLSLLSMSLGMERALKFDERDDAYLLLP